MQSGGAVAEAKVPRIAAAPHLHCSTQADSDSYPVCDQSGKHARAVVGSITWVKVSDTKGIRYYTVQYLNTYQRKQNVELHDCCCPGEVNNITEMDPCV